MSPDIEDGVALTSISHPLGASFHSLGLSFLLKPKGSALYRARLRRPCIAPDSLETFLLNIIGRKEILDAKKRIITKNGRMPWKWKSKWRAK